MPKREGRLKYGFGKYAAFNLLLARWIRLFAKPVSYNYVTLGGTEMIDIQYLKAVDQSLITSVQSFEQDATRYDLADQTRAQLQSSIGLDVELINSDLLSFERTDFDRPHVFFIDLEGIFASADYVPRIGEMLMNEYIKEDDCIFVTSYLGRNAGWQRIFSEYEGEYSILGISSEGDKKAYYKDHHPSFTMYRALSSEDLCDELEIKNFGRIMYRDSSPMGLYGFMIREGATDFRSMVLDPDSISFDVRKGFVN